MDTRMSAVEKLLQGIDTIWIWHTEKKRPVKISVDRVEKNVIYGLPNQVAIKNRNKWHYHYFSINSDIECWERAVSRSIKELNELKKQYEVAKEFMEDFYPSPDTWDKK